MEEEVLHLIGKDLGYLQQTPHRYIRAFSTQRRTFSMQKKLLLWNWVSSLHKRVSSKQGVFCRIWLRICNVETLLVVEASLALEMATPMSRRALTFKYHIEIERTSFLQQGPPRF